LVLVWCVSVSSGEVSGLTQVLQFPMLFSSRSKLTERGRDRETVCCSGGVGGGGGWLSSGRRGRKVVSFFCFLKYLI
jgi:hypothetical protein